MGYCTNSQQLKSKISAVGCLYLLNVVFCNLANLFFGDFIKFSFNKLKAYLLCFGRGIVYQIFGKGHKCVGVAAVKNLTRFAKLHKAVARSALAVAGGAEGGNVV